MSKTISGYHFNRLFSLIITSICCLLMAETSDAARYYSKHRNTYYSCPNGYQLVFIQEHWNHGYFVPGRYICAPVQYRQRHMHRDNRYYYYQDNRGRHYRNW